MRYQLKDKKLIKFAEHNNDYSKHNFYGGDDNYSLIYKYRKIVIPKQ